jgi:hypothetical protein
LRIVENSVHVLAAIGSGVLVNDDVDALWAWVLFDEKVDRRFSLESLNNNAVCPLLDGKVQCWIDGSLNRVSGSRFRQSVNLCFTVIRNALEVVRVMICCAFRGGIWDWCMRDNISTFRVLLTFPHTVDKLTHCRCLLRVNNKNSPAIRIVYFGGNCNREILDNHRDFQFVDDLTGGSRNAGNRGDFKFGSCLIACQLQCVRKHLPLWEGCISNFMDDPEVLSQEQGSKWKVRSFLTSRVFAVLHVGAHNWYTLSVGTTKRLWDYWSYDWVDVECENPLREGSNSCDNVKSVWGLGYTSELECKLELASEHIVARRIFINQTFLADEVPNKIISYL